MVCVNITKRSAENEPKNPGWVIATDFHPKISQQCLDFSLATFVQNRLKSSLRF